MTKSKKKTNKPELIAHMERVGLTPEMTTLFLDQLRIFIGDNIKNGVDVTLPSIGKITADLTPSRIGRNPRTGEEHIITERFRYGFSISKTLKNSIENYLTRRKPPSL